MAQNKAVDADPKEVKAAQQMWHDFTHLVKISCVSIAVLLALMAIFLV